MRPACRHAVDFSVPRAGPRVSSSAKLDRVEPRPAFTAPGWITRDRSCVRVDSEFLGGEGRPQCGQFADCTTAHALCPAVSENTRSGEDGEVTLSASLDDDRLPSGTLGNAAKGVLTTVLKNERNG